ncbi:MAG: T9SS type A sorting domain-containing protein, partial [Bacteroidetes bacterium]|nr:T9SS type A sorting domain-containing protein [Bacteroidota bacterium]
TWDFGDGSPSGSGNQTSHTYPPIPSATYNTCVSYDNACGTVEWCADVKFDAMGNHIPTPPIFSSVEEIIDSEIEFDISPNPFQHKTQISYSLSSRQKQLELAIYDVNGRMVKRMDLQETKGSITIDLSQFSAGIYQAKLLADGVELANKKMALSK